MTQGIAHSKHMGLYTKNPPWNQQPASLLPDVLKNENKISFLGPVPGICW